ncbi:MAG: hypothetical protein A2539_06445 [Elusimicrobia bacterium RIFOXYD2_FULL_34_15]|nr:MAG: hypothetical protein A2539_06445 [Elusimicrobia bacterium RIFOXYD2_FULL_34_15]
MMDIIQQWFQNNLDIVFFVYGFAFVVMGIAILIQPKKESEFRIADILWLLAIFGITHGLSEFLDMWSIIKKSNTFFDIFRWFILVISYCLLFEFGRQLFSLGKDRNSFHKRIASVLTRWLLLIILIFIFIFAFMSADFLKIGNILVRYFLGFTGCILITFGFSSYYKCNEIMLKSLKVKRYFILASLSFLVYGFLGGLVVPKANFFPADWFNMDLFFEVIHIPVQFFRAICAVIVSWVIIRMLKIFNWEMREKFIESTKVLEKRLIDVEKRYQDIVENASDMIHSVNIDGHIVFANRKECEILGYSREELDGKYIKEIYAPETWDNVKKGFEKLRHEGILFVENGKMIKKNGEKLDVIINSSAIYDSVGNFVRTRSIIKNVTEQKYAEYALKQSEKHYRMLFDKMNEGFALCEMIWDEQNKPIDFRYLSVNQSWENNTGIRCDMAMNHTIREIIPSIEQFWIDKYAEVVQTGNPVHIENRVKSLDKWFEVFAYKYSDNKFAAIFSDITERKNMEKEKEKLQAQLLQSEKMAAVGQLAGGVAHEINNPMGVILGFAQSVVKMVKEGDSLYIPLKSIEREAIRCKKLVSNLLTFSRIDDKVKDKADINVLIDDTISLVEAHAKIKNIEIIKRYVPDLPQIEINKNQIEQVIVNLCNNAMDAMPEGGTITITTSQIDADLNAPACRQAGINADKKYIIISISDTGVGMSEEVKKHVFEPFYTTKEVGKGTGLGLSICYEIIKKHNGTIEVESEVGKGTTFVVKLPVKVAGE